MTPYGNADDRRCKGPGSRLFGDYHPNNADRPRIMSMITRAEAESMAMKLVRDSAPPEMRLIAAVREFDLGYVAWAQRPPDHSPLFGASRGIIDRHTGELSVWSSLPVDLAINQFRVKRTGHPPRRWTWDPAAQLRWDLGHAATQRTSPTRCLPRAR